jgi:hypothetical protein
MGGQRSTKDGTSDYLTDNPSVATVCLLADLAGIGTRGAPLVAPGEEAGGECTCTSAAVLPWPPRNNV